MAIMVTIQDSRITEIGARREFADREEGGCRRRITHVIIIVIETTLHYRTFLWLVASHSAANDVMRRDGFFAASIGQRSARKRT